MADTIIPSYSQASPAGLHGSTIRVLAGDDISIDVGMPLTTGSRAIFARANAAATANVIGLAATAGEAPGHVDAQFQGPITLTTEQWDARTGQSGGLTPHSIYYLSTAVGAKITTVAPSEGNYVTPVGFALSPTTMMIQLRTAVIG